MSNLVSTQSFIKDKVQEELNRPVPEIDEILLSRIYFLQLKMDFF